MLIILISLLVAVATFVVFRIVHVLRNICDPKKSRSKLSAVKTMIILGSGGHTTEMMAMVKELDSSKYFPRMYVLAESDTTSTAKVRDIELHNANDYEIVKIARSRQVHQSYFSSIFTTIYSILTVIPLVYQSKPDLILCNGPGTCVPICLIAFALKLLFINEKCKIVFIESYCRVKTLSLSGKILVWFVDSIVVHWPHQTKLSKRVQYFGRLL